MVLYRYIQRNNYSKNIWNLKTNQRKHPYVGFSGIDCSEEKKKLKNEFGHETKNTNISIFSFKQNNIKI